MSKKKISLALCQRGIDNGKLIVAPSFSNTSLIDFVGLNHTYYCAYLFDAKNGQLYEQQVLTTDALIHASCSWITKPVL